MKKSRFTKLGRSLITSLNPFAKNREYSSLDCGVVALDMVDGMVDGRKKIALQTTDATWFGSLEINLKQETLDMGMHPKPRKGMGTGSGGLAKLVHVGGTLKNPKIRLNPKEVAANYANYSVAVATGGASMLFHGLWNKRQANEDVCEDILKTFHEQIKGRKRKSR